MRKKLLLLLVLLGILFSSGISLANVDLYVKNQPFPHQQVIHQERVYVQIEPFLKALGFGWEVSNGLIKLHFQEKGFPCPEISGFTFSFKWNEAIVKITYLPRFGKIFVPVRDTAEKLGAVCLFNPKTNIADVLYSHPGGAATTFTSEVSSEGKPVESKTKTEEEPKKEDPIKAEFKYFQDYNPAKQALGGDVRGTVTVKNTSNEKVKGVTVIVHITNLKGDEIHKETYDIGDMEAGATVEKKFFWINPNPLIVFKHKLEIKYEGKDGQKED